MLKLREFEMLMILANSDYNKGGILKEKLKGVKNDFQRLLGSNSLTFINYLIQRGILYQADKKKDFVYKGGDNRPLWSIDSEKLHELLRESQLYLRVYHYIDKKFGILNWTEKNPDKKI